MHDISAWSIMLTVAAYFAVLLIVSRLTSGRGDTATFFRGTRCGVRCLVNIPVVGKINIDSLAVTCKLPITVKQ